MTALVIDRSRIALQQRGIAAASGAVGTQRTFNAKMLLFAADRIEQRIKTLGRLYQPATITGTKPTVDDTGAVVGNPIAPDARTHTLVIGSTGVFRGYSAGTCGWLSPTTLGTGAIIEMLLNTTSTFLRVNTVSGAQIPGIANVIAQFIGGPLVTCPWVPASFRYQSANGQAALATFFTANLGNAVGVTITTT